MSIEAAMPWRILPLTLLAVTVVAHANSFDIASFDPPRGWEELVPKSEMIFLQRARLNRRSR